MPDIKKMTDKDNIEFYPRTVLNAVYDTNTGRALSNGVPASRYRTLTVDNPISDSSQDGYEYSQTFTWDNVLATDNASMGIVTGYSTDNAYAVETKADAVKLYFDEDPTDAVVIVHVYPSTTGTLEDNAASEIEARVTALELGDVYSTTEHVVGRWIDSKPIYEKTIEATLPSNTTGSDDTLIDVSELNIDKCIRLEAFHLASFANPIIPGYLQHSATWNGQVLELRAFYAPATEKIDLRREVGSSGIPATAGATAYVTIRYTKTTD